MAQHTDFTNGYEIKSYRALRNESFEASIYLHGKRVLAVENDGRGGCNRYEPVDSNGGYLAQLQNLKEAAVALGFDGVEPEDAFVNALINVKIIASNAKKLKVTFESEAEHMIRTAIGDSSEYFAGEIALLRAIGAGMAAG